MYSKDNFTYGAELEFADVLLGQELPFGNQWNKKDFAIINSNGIANDPLGRTCKYGGEINTKPTNSIEEQVENFKQILKILNPKPIVNYSCNLHIHIGISGLRNDLEMLKKIMTYVYQYGKLAFNLIDSIPIPNKNDYESNEAYGGALKRYKRRRVSHHYLLPKSRIDKILFSETIDDFFKNHAVKNKDGRPLFHLMTRQAINLFQLYNETETIEFRHFPQTLDIEEFKNSLEWCSDFLYEAMTEQKSPEILFESKNWKFPKFELYNHKLALGYKVTSIKYHSRKEIMEYLINQ